MAIININFADVDEKSQGSSALPAGDYNVFVVRSEDKTTSTGSHQVSLFLEVADGPLAGRRTWINLVYATANGSPVNRDGKQLLGAIHLKRIAIACGVDASRGLDLDLLPNKPFRATLVLTKDNQNRDRNELRGVPDFDKTPGARKLASAPGAPVQVAAPPPPAAPAAPGAGAAPSAGLPPAW